LKLLLDEMYPAARPRLCVPPISRPAPPRSFGLAGRSDPDGLGCAIAQGYTVLTESVADFARISADHLSAGQHHNGVLIALSSRFSRRPTGIDALVAAIQAVGGG